MLKNAYFLAKIGADTAENEQHVAEICQKLATTLRVLFLPATAGPAERLDVPELAMEIEIPFFSYCLVRRGLSDSRSRARENRSDLYRQKGRSNMNTLRRSCIFFYPFKTLKK